MVKITKPFFITEEYLESLHWTINKFDHKYILLRRERNLSIDIT